MLITYGQKHLSCVEHLGFSPASTVHTCQVLQRPTHHVPSLASYGLSIGPA
jgi:hypothetical protein